MALVRKILEATIPSGGYSATFTDSDIPNSLIRVYSTNSNIYPQNISLSGNTLTVTYEVVSSALGVAVELVKQGLEIDDNLTSENTDHALSAKQGKVLKGLIDNIPDDLSSLSDVDITDIEDGQILSWDDTAQKFVNVDQSGDVVYTLDETVIGKWINNKPLYQKTLYFDGTAPRNTWTNHNISNVDMIWVYDCFGKRNSDYRYNGINYFGSDDYMAIAVNRTQIYISYPTETIMTNCYVTLRYTKTTD